MAHRYRVGEFARLTGVTVRTLHHYDRIGLLHPALRNEGGQRLYSDEDLLIMEQINGLRRCGFALDEIGSLLGASDIDVLASLRAQRAVVRSQADALRALDAALEHLVAERIRTEVWDWSLVADAAARSATRQNVNGEGNMDDVRKLYTEEQLRQFDDLRQELGDETIRAIERDWTDLLGDVRAARGSSPESPEAQALADRWSVLMERTMAPYQSKPGLSDAIGENYRSGKFENVEGAPSAEDFAFIQAALDARKS